MAILSFLPVIVQIENVRTFLICIAVFLCSYWYFQKPKNVPPGPLEWPIIGCLPVLLQSVWQREQGHDLMTRLSQRYGKVFSIGLGSGVRVVILNDFKSIKEAFNKPELSDRYPAPRIRKITPGKGVLVASGQVWKHQRRFSLGVFRSFGVGKTSYDDQIAIEADHLSREVSGFTGKPFDPRRLLMNATSNMICAIVFGKRFDYKDEEFQRLLALLDERVELIGSGGLQAQVPLLALLNFNKMKALTECLRKNLEFFGEIVKEHKANFEENGNCKDLTDLYLKAMQEAMDVDAANNINEDHLKMLMDNLFLAGTETSSNTLAWCLLHMIADTEVQQRVRDEIIDVCGDGGRLPSYSDRARMPYTEAVILESQRLHTIVPLGVPHYAGRETTLHGYRIPQGSLVISNIWAVHHDPEVWDDPDVFRPSRFWDQKGNVDVREEWIPFSSGRRVCLGERLAKMEIFIFLTHLLARYKFTKPSTSPPVSFEGRSGVTYGPQPFEVCAHPI